MLAAILLGAVLAGLAMPARSTRGVVVERHASAEIHQGDEALVEVIVHGARRSTRRGLLVHDPMLELTDLWVGPVAPGERVELITTRVARRRGRHGGEPVIVRSSAPFGVAERRRTVHVEASATLVLPVVEPLGIPALRESRRDDEIALHAAPRRGQGPEFLGIREYRPGDSMRHVHWASTARTGASWCASSNRKRRGSSPSWSTRPAMRLRRTTSSHLSTAPARRPRRSRSRRSPTATVRGSSPGQRPARTACARPRRRAGAAGATRAARTVVRSHRFRRARLVCYRNPSRSRDRGARLSDVEGERRRCRGAGGRVAHPAHPDGGGGSRRHRGPDGRAQRARPRRPDAAAPSRRRVGLSLA